jgi:hypothetical protein
MPDRGDDDGGNGGGSRDGDPGLSDSLEDDRTLTTIEESIDWDYNRKFGVTVREVACVPESDRKRPVSSSSVSPISRVRRRRPST